MNPITAPSSRQLRTTALLTALCTASAASAMAPAEEQDEAFMTLIHLLETDIATRTELVDADYAPGQVTVLRGDDIIAKGKRTVGEALTLLTGYDLNFQPIIRGVGGTLSGASGKVKFMLNGVPINDNLISTPRTLTFLPANQVEKIEFIRGPGSAVHGEFAFSGVINVVTRQSDNSAFVRYGSFDTYTAGASFDHWTENGFHINANVAGWQSKGPNLNSGTDALFEGFFAAAGQSALSLAPGEPSLASDNVSAFLNIGHGDTKLAVHHVNLGDGIGYGLANILPERSDDTVITDRLTSIEMTHQQAIGASLDLRAKAGYQEFQTSFDINSTAPPGFFGIYPDGIQFRSNYAERRRYAGLDVTWHAPKDHTLLFGAEYSSTRSRDVFVESNQDFNNVVPGTPFAAPTPDLIEAPSGYGDRSRRIISLYAQDEYAVSPDFIVTAGLRYDSYSDIDDNVAPRIAAVYHLQEAHTIKAQYGEAFRPPNFAELYNISRINTGNPDNEPETIKTFELAYIYKAPSTTLRVVAFHSTLDALLVAVNNQVFNSGSAKTQGLELEWEYEFTPTLKSDGNLAYVDTEDDQTGEPLAGAADILGNLGLIYQPHKNHIYTLQIRHIGERHRAVGDSRGKLGAQTTLDLAANIHNALNTGLTLRAGVKNLFDEDVRNPAPADTFRNDYALEGRSFWVQLEKDFK